VVYALNYKHSKLGPTAGTAEEQPFHSIQIQLQCSGK